MFVTVAAERETCAPPFINVPRFIIKEILKGKFALSRVIFILQSGKQRFFDLFIDAFVLTG